MGAYGGPKAMEYDDSIPLADAGERQFASIGDTVVLDGSGSYDSKGNALEYNWFIYSKPQDSEAVLSATNTETSSFVKDAEGVFIIGLIVNNGIGSSPPDYVIISEDNWTVVPFDCPSIESACENAELGDNIYVSEGEYSLGSIDGFTVPERVKLIGAGVEKTAIISSGVKHMAILENNSSIEGFTIYGDRSDDEPLFYGDLIWIDGNDCTVKDNIVITNGRTLTGIKINNSTSGSIHDNVVYTYQNNSYMNCWIINSYNIKCYNNVFAGSANRMGLIFTILRV